MVHIRTTLKKLKAQGLVEALIAIAVAGIACLVFLDLAVQNMAEVNNAEISDNLAKSAAEIGAEVRRIVDKDNNRAIGTASLLPDLSQASVIANQGCYQLVGGISDAQFVPPIAAACVYSDINTCRDKQSSNPDRIFKVYCINSLSNNLLIGKVVVGQTSCQKIGKSDNCIVPNYEYTIVTKVNQNYLCGNGTCDSLYGETNANCAVDCAPPLVCGDGKIQGTEQCEVYNGVTSYYNGITSCHDVNPAFTSGAGSLSCSSCNIVTNACTTCGNGQLDNGEQCDGTLFGGATCADYGAFTGGNLICTSSCTVSTAGCVNVKPPKPKCGNSICELGETNVNCPKDCSSVIFGPPPSNQ